MIRTVGYSILMAAALLSGCAVQEGKGRNVNVVLDTDEFLGQDVAVFKLTDGSEGRIRMYNGRYSIKLQKYHKVIPLDRVQVTKVVGTHVVGNRTVLVVEGATRSCNYKTYVFSFQGSESLQWDFGDCKTSPSLGVADDELTFDYVRGRTTTRYTYKDARLLKGSYTAPREPTVRPVAPPRREASSDASTLPRAPSEPQIAEPRFNPGAPNAAGDLGNESPPSSPDADAPTQRRPPERTANQAPPRPTAARPVRVAAAPAPRPSPAPVFASEEQKPVRIVLD